MSIIKNNRINALASILFVVVIWGSGSTVTKLGVQEMPPFLFALLRNCVASLLLLLIYLYRRNTIPQQSPLRLPYKKIAWMGLTGITFFYVFFNLSLVYTSAAAGALIQGFIPVGVALLAVLFLKERLDGPHMLGIILSVVGVFLVGFVGNGSQAGNSLPGNGLMIIAVLCWAMYTVVSKSLQHYDPFMVTAFSTLAGTIFLVPVVVLEQWGKPVPAVSGNAWAAILYLSIVSSTICYLLYNWTLKILPASTVGNFLNLDAVIGVVIAIIFLKDKITIWQLAGGLLVLVGVVLSSGASRQSKQEWREMRG